MARLPGLMAVGLAVGLLVSAATAQEAKNPTYLVIPVKGTIGQDFTAARMKSFLAEAAKMKVNVVVLEVNTPGGFIVDAEKIVDLLIGCKDIRVVSFVRRALSAGAAITLACPEIYMTETATIGAATPYELDRRGVPATIAEKFQSAWRAVCRKAAEHGGYPSAIADAMVDRDFQLTLPIKGKPVILKRKGKILTLTAREAVACGLAKGMVADLKALGQQLGMPDWQERRIGPGDIRHGLRDLTPTKLYDTFSQKAQSLRVFEPGLTELQKDEAQKKWAAWLKKQRFDGRRVRWALSVLEVKVHDFKELQSLRAAIKAGRCDHRWRYLPMYKRYVAKYKKALRLGPCLIQVTATSPDNRQIPVVAWVKKSDKDYLALVPREGIVVLSGRIEEVEFGPLKNRGLVMQVTLESCKVVKAKAAIEPKEPVEPVEVAELQAQRKLELARNYERGGMTDKAREILQSLITSFPQTKAAEEAKKRVELLDKP